MPNYPNFFTAAMLLVLYGCGSNSSSNLESNGPVASLNRPISPDTLARDDDFGVPEGQILNVPAPGVLANDIASPGATLALQTLPTLGRVELLQDGSFLYEAREPLSSFEDSFTYILRSDLGSSIATARIAIEQRRFFVKNDASAGDGRFETPFNQLAAALVAASGVEDSEIVLFPGDGTDRGQDLEVDLEPRQTLRGVQGQPPPVLSGTIRLASGATLENLKIVAGPEEQIYAGELESFSMRNIEAPDTSIIVREVTGSVSMQNVTVKNGMQVLLEGGGNLAANVQRLRSRSGITFRVAQNSTLDWQESETILEGSPQHHGYMLDVRSQARMNFRLSDCSYLGISNGGLLMYPGEQAQINFRIENSLIRSGMQIEASEQGQVKGRVVDTQFELGAVPGVTVLAFENSSVGLRFLGVNAERYDLENRSPNASILVENLNQFSTENSGPLFKVGSVVHQELDSLGLP